MTDHEVDAGAVAFAFDLPEPTVRRRRSRDASAAAFAFDLPEPTVRRRRSRDASAVAFAFGLPEPTTRSELRRNAVAAAFTFDHPEPTVTKRPARIAALLPVNSTPLERALEAATRPRVSSDVIRQVWDPWACPAKLLPWLAWALSVDYWEDDWTEKEKRAVIAASIEVHRRKGTPAAMHRVVENLGFGFALVEWWELTPEGTPGTAEAFIFRAGAERHVAIEDLGLIRRLLANVKRGTLHLRVTVAHQISTRGYLYARSDAHKYQSFSYNVSRVEFAESKIGRIYLYAHADAYEHQEFSYEVGR